MKKLFLILLITPLLILTSIKGFSQVDTSIWSLQKNGSDGKYSLLTNKVSFHGIGAGTIMVPLQFSLSDIDTSQYSLMKNQSDGKYSIAINKISLYGIDSGKIKVSVIYNLNGGINTANDYTWTGIQHFDSIFVNIMYLNKIDSVKSTYWYRPDKSVFGFIDPSIDSVYFPKMYVKDLSGQTIVTSTSITSNKIYSDSIIGHSPIFLFADSVILQNKLLVPYIAMNTAGNFISRFAIGMTDSTGAFNIVRTDKNTNRSTLSQATDTSSFNFRFTPTGKPVLSIKDNLGVSIFSVDSTGTKIITTSAPNILTISTSYGDITIGGNGDYGSARPTIRSSTADLLLAATSRIWSKQNYSIYNKGGYGDFVNYPLYGSLGYRYLDIGWSADSIATITVNNIGAYTARAMNIFVSGANLNLKGDQTVLYSGATVSAYTSGSNLMVNGNLTLYGTGSSIFTNSLTLNIDSIGSSKSDTIKLGKNTMIVNCDNTNNDTVYLANIGISDGFECTVKKVDANATYVVVKPKGSLTIDGATEDKFNTQWVSKTYIYKNKSWYIK